MIIYQKNNRRNKLFQESFATIKKRKMEENPICNECGINLKELNRYKFQIFLDHIIPFSIDGGNNSENLQLLCKKCNKEKCKIDNSILYCFRNLGFINTDTFDILFYVEPKILHELYFYLFKLYKDALLQKAK